MVTEREIKDMEVKMMKDMDLWVIELELMVKGRKEWVDVVDVIEYSQEDY